ncbi:hypothetical protein BDQ17DRAFT_1434395 [Cyathus striatus]|nr:hypothetical protein BDQ17DRAFT_1434395 [Cyathus striatus]
MKFAAAATFALILATSIPLSIAAPINISSTTTESPRSKVGVNPDSVDVFRWGK